MGRRIVARGLPQCLSFNGLPQGTDSNTAVVGPDQWTVNGAGLQGTGLAVDYPVFNSGQSLGSRRPIGIPGVGIPGVGRRISMTGRPQGPEWTVMLWQNGARLPVNGPVKCGLLVTMAPGSRAKPSGTVSPGLCHPQHHQRQTYQND